MKAISMLAATAAKKTTDSLSFLATTINTNIDLDELAGGFVDFLLDLALYGGAITAVVGGISWAFAHKNGDSGGQDKSMNSVLIGVALMGFRGVLELIGILN